MLTTTVQKVKNFRMVECMVNRKIHSQQNQVSVAHFQKKKH